ncbi:MAG: hypothetical protein IKO42_01105 [Opitutales bacterium]|nr:hypothetical protein [Opitutales bacterium]
MDNLEMLNFAREAAQKAGDRLRGITARRVNSDAANDVKLQEDVESEIFIRGLLAQTGIEVVGEEKGGDASLISRKEPYWVVDPIDGTFNFLRGLPNVSVSIGLMRGMEPIVGAVYDFTRGEMFSGGREFGLFLNGEKVSPRWAKSRAQAVVMTGFPSITDYSDENMKRFVKRMQTFKKVRMCGSAAIACAWVASGRADCYDERGINLWDIAAGLALIEGAGGVWKCEGAGIEGRPLTFNLQLACREEFYIKD